MSIQPMPDLDSDQWDALVADIVANGVLVPVIKDQHGRILDGNNRAKIAEQLGIDYPVKIVEVTDDDDAWDKAVALNCARRHLNREQKRELIRAEILRRPDQTDRAISRRLGCSPSTVGAVRAVVNEELAAAEADEQRRAEAIKAEERRRANQLTEDAREALQAQIGQWAMIAVGWHRKGRSWQIVGDVLERLVHQSLDDLAAERGDDPQIDESLWRHFYGPFFDSVRAEDCESDCTVCTPHDREWRDSHPRQVYRWAEVSNLDTETAVEE